MTKNKHDHTATKKIKAWLFAIMLLLPFLFLLPTGLYYGLNQNAQLSERIEETPIYYQTNEITSANDFVVDNVYYWSDNFNLTQYPSETSYLFQIKKTYTIENIISNYEYANTISFIVRNDSYAMYLRVEYDNNISSQYFNVLNKEFSFVFLKMTNTTTTNEYINYFSSSNQQVIKEYVDITYTNDISTSIINAWNSTWQNPLFSWTNYSPFYAPMQSFTNVFGINNMQIANVLTYLATITAIYIVFDIVIELFTYLTHLIPRSD